MNFEIFFSVVGVLSFIGWGALIISPFRHTALIMLARIISIVLAVLYIYLLVALWGEEPKVDFSSLAGVANGFSNMGHLLTGWIHFLALDLYIGAWQVERAKKVGIAYIVLLPCLVLTFLVGPLGLFLFIMIQSIKMRAFKLA